MTFDLDDEVFEGRLAKVIHVEDESRQVYARYENGNTCIFTVSEGQILPSPTECILLSSNTFRFADESAWISSNTIGIVKCILPDGSLLVDSGISLSTVVMKIDMMVNVNNTIEYNEIDGVIRILSDSPLRSREYATTDEDITKEYLLGVPEEKLTFDDFGGYPNVIERARTLIETQLNQGEILKKIGARPVRGILFSGPPGTGKTHLARIIAQQSKADFFLVSGPSIVSKWVGDTEEVLRKIFEAAAKSQKKNAIIFFDEIDSIAEQRTSNTNEASSRLIAQLLTLMDGFDATSNIVVIAATNRAEALDPALTRPGRFDWEIEFGIPSYSDRFEILGVSTKSLAVAGELPLEDIATLTEGWSAAKLTSIWVEAALIAAAEGRSSISSEDTAHAFELVSNRPDRSSDIRVKQ